MTEDLLSRNQVLASFFFFRRGGSDRNKIARLFPTLASQVAAVSPQFKEALHRSLDGMSKDEIEKKSITKQFEILMSTPLQATTAMVSGTAPKVLVIDALDECDDFNRVDTEEGRKLLETLLNLFSRLAHIGNARLRILLTSRSDPYIVETMIENDLVLPFDLDHQDLIIDTRVDIRTFLTQRLVRISKAKRLKGDWPSRRDLEYLFERANDPEPLFIYAATFILFIEGKGRTANPKSQLQKWITQSGGSASRLGPIYEPVINQALGDAEDDDGEELGRLMLFLGALCLLVQPLSEEAIAELLGFESDGVRQWITSLHAVLVVEGSEDYVRLRHKSFSDFLLESQSAEFHVTGPKIHNELAQLCILQMQAGLEHNVCKLKDPSVEHADFSWETVCSCISEEMRYACEHWVHHLLRSNLQPLDKMWDFIEEHFLHWLEVMSLLGLVPQAIEATSALLEDLRVRTPQLLLGSTTNPDTL